MGSAASIRLGTVGEPVPGRRMVKGGKVVADLINCTGTVIQVAAAPLPAVINLFRLLDKHPELLKELV